MNIREFFKKNWENIVCFGAAGLMALIGLVAFLCLYNSR